MNPRDHSGQSKGFTLIEILMALFIGLILLAAIYVSVSTGQKSSAGVERKVAAQQDIRAALEVMAMEISMASYNPNFISSLWIIPPPQAGACVGSSTNQQYKGIQEATPTSLTVEMDIDKNSAIGNSSNEVIRYVYSPADQAIFRNANCLGNSSFLGDVAGAAQGSRTVRVINTELGITNGNANPAVAVFRYYDAKSPATELLIDTSTGMNTNLIPNIRRIDITLGVETEEVDPSTNQRRRMTYSTSVLVRNHVLNN